MAVSLPACLLLTQFWSGLTASGVSLADNYVAINLSIVVGARSARVPYPALADGCGQAPTDIADVTLQVGALQFDRPGFVYLFPQ